MGTDRRVAFLRGIMGRSGTNFLRDLLLIHPDCARARPPVWEDFFLDEAHRLTGFADAVTRRWPAKWEVPQPATQRALLAALGAGLCGFLADGAPGKVVLSKTPSAVGLEHYFTLFGDAPLILLVRDGRAVVDSAMRSFGWSFERAVREWARGGELILRFDAAYSTSHADRYRIVRYEDLVANVVDGGRELSGFLGLDPLQFDGEAANALPVRGSSALVDDEGGLGTRPHWRPVPRDEARSRLASGHDWSAAQRQRFSWLAGDTMEKLGYRLEPSNPEPVRQRAADTKWAVSTMARRTGTRVRRRRVV